MAGIVWSPVVGDYTNYAILEGNDPETGQPFQLYDFDEATRSLLGNCLEGVWDKRRESEDDSDPYLYTFNGLRDLFNEAIRKDTRAHGERSLWHDKWDNITVWQITAELYGENPSDFEAGTRQCPERYQWLADPWRWRARAQNGRYYIWHRRIAGTRIAVKMDPSEPWHQAPNIY